ncbi:MAG TPA: hypothetical protein VFC01_14195 [Mycobacterium sp.]|nr:hypothetical protein [Mycobacterium sp.]
MARTKNIFDYASKVLSATAFWAWVLDAENADDATLNAINADLRSKLALPQQARLVDVVLAKNPDDPRLMPHLPSEEGERDDRKRIDILATYRLPERGLLDLSLDRQQPTHRFAVIARRRGRIAAAQGARR